MSIAPLDDARSFAAALSYAVGALRTAAAQATWQLAESDLGEGVQQLEQVVRLAQAQQVRLAAEAQQRGLPGQGGHRGLAGWLGQVLPTHTDAEAQRLTRRAETFYLAPVAADLAPAREALLAGEVSGSQADAISAAVVRLVPPAVPAGEVPEPAIAQSQALLLQRAEFDDATALARIGQRLHAILDPDADDRLAKDETVRDRARGLTTATLRSGLVHVEGLLTPRCGAALTAAIDAWSAPQPAADGTPDARTPAQRRHDGLQRLAEEARTRPGLLPSSHGSPYRILTTVGVEALAAALAGQPAPGVLPAELPDSTPLSSTSLAEIACGADVVPVLVDTDGNPLDVGDTQYAFPAKQRLAIALRDRHCTYPGCTAPPAWCDVHHLQAFRAGGRTSVANGALLCGRHHRRVHATGSVGRLARGQVVWTTGPPPGEPAADAPPTRTRATAAVEHLARRWRLRRRE